MAIEGAPRVPDDHDKLKDASDGAESTSHVQPPDAWQQFKDRIFGPKPEVDSDKDTTEEDDESEDDENGEVTTVKGKSKTRRFRRALRGLIAQKAEVPEDEGHGAAHEGSTPYVPSVGDGVGEHNWRVDAPEEGRTSTEPGISDDYEAVYRGNDELPEVASYYHDASGAEIGDPVAPVEIDNSGEEQVFEPERQSPVLDSLPTVPTAPEDLRTILERQHHVRNEQTPEEGTIDSTASSSGVIFESVSSDSPRGTERFVERADNTAALLAVDLLSHRAGKRRDKKIDASSVARDKDLDKRMQQGNRALEDKLQHQQKVQRELERQLQKKEHALPRIRHGAEFPLPADNNREPIANKVVENTTRERVDSLPPRYVQNFEARSPVEKPIVAIPDIALPSAETILHRVEAAAEKSVPIENEYELRHERKGNNDFSTLEETGGAVEQQLSQANQALQGMNVLDNPKSARPIEQKADEYKQAVASGAWGAVVGVLLFVAYIMLTK